MDIRFAHTTTRAGKEAYIFFLNGSPFPAGVTIKSAQNFWKAYTADHQVKAWDTSRLKSIETLYRKIEKLMPEHPISDSGCQQSWNNPEAV